MTFQFNANNTARQEDFIEEDFDLVIPESEEAPKLTPTTEQVAAQEIVKGNHRVKLNAYAGCSKTTTLVMVADQLPMNSLYLAYNKAMATEAKEKFPAWVKVSTTHALAYAVYGRELQHKLKRPTGAYKNVCGTGGEIARYFKIKDYALDEFGLARITAAGIGVAIKETVNAFEYSADEIMTQKHVSGAGIKKLKQSQLSPEVLLQYSAIVLKNAKLLWELRKNPNIDVLATHDTYLKLYQLSKPDLSKYEVIYLDEGQDTNQCVLDFIMSQTVPKVVVVGDGYQQIYQWRGSVNAMEQLPFVEGKLSCSFRFGQAVADVANTVLNTAGGHIGAAIKGWEGCESETHSFYDMPEEEVAKLGSYTLLYRSNMALILDAVSLLGKGKKVNLEIDVKDFVKLLESAVELRANNMKGVKHEELLPYESWKDFAEEVGGTGGELGRIHKIIDEGDVYTVLGRLATHRNVDNPDVVMTTAHKSKGREWDRVVLANDFASCWNSKGEWVGLSDAERNLLYVAVTRARKLLVWNSTVQELMDRVSLGKHKPL